MNGQRRLNAPSQEREDELKYLDLHEAEPWWSMPRRVSFDAPYLIALSVVTLVMLLLLTALILVVREEWRFILRVFS